MKRMNGLFMGLGIAVFGLSQAANAIDIPFDPDGAGPLKFLGTGAPAGIPMPQLSGLDWAPGNAVAVDAVPLVVGNEFTVHYQAKLSVFNIAGGGTATTFNDGSGLLSGIGTLSAPATFEWTINARFKERVVGLVGNTAFFEVIDDPSFNYLKVFFDNTPDANDAAGTGFTDGLEILSATDVLVSNSQFSVVGAGVLDTAPASGASVHGSGSFNISARIDTHDNAFLDLNSIVLGQGEVRISLITSTLELPFGPTDPAAQFEVVGGGPVVPNIGLVNGVNGPDFLFEADGNQVFDVRADVPEPATAALGLLGLAGLAARRRRLA